MQVSGPVWLVGMMGAGKSSVGRALARRLRLPFRDTDAEIERAAGRSVAEIFASEGEAGFRARERAAAEASADRRAVVALGGGAIAQPEIAAIVSRAGTIVYLRARPETLLARVGAAQERPLLAGLRADERLERVRSLLAEREAAYAGAQVCVDTDGSSVEDLVDEILERLGAA